MRYFTIFGVLAGFLSFIRARASERVDRPNRYAVMEMSFYERTQTDIGRLGSAGFAFKYFLPFSVVGQMYVCVAGGTL